MRTLDRKLLRDLRARWGQVTAIGLIVACGVASFVTVLTAYRGLQGTLEAYYGRYRMADLFAPVKRAPRAAARALEEVPGVRRVQPRIVFDVTLDLPDLDQPASGRVISVPARRDRPLCDLHLVRGRWFEDDGVREVILAARFAREHGLDVGDRLRVVMNNRKEALRIVALAQSPEFIYLIRGQGEILPDARTFTVLWLAEPFAEAVFGFKDACNDFVATLDPGAALPDVIDAFDEVLDPYGAIGAYARKDQLSHRYVSDEIKGLKGSATLTPTIFLGVAAFVLHMMLGRLVRTQRTQIALLRAFGYRTREVAAHYLKMALSVALLGAVLGAGAGIWFAKGLAGLYQEFFSFPFLVFDVDPLAVAGGAAASLFFAALGALGAVWDVARLAPAEGLQPEAPRLYRRTLLERAGFLWRRLSFTTRMVIRNLARTRRRAAITGGALALGASILLLANFSVDAVEHLMDVQWRLAERQDVRLAFHEDRSLDALYELRRFPGVLRAEAELNVPVRLVNGWRERLAAITGIEPDGTLRALLDAKQRHVPPPRDGLLLSRKLADLLAVDVGDVLEVRVQTGEKPVLHIPVENVVEEYLGVFAYADLGRLSRWVGEETVLNGALLRVAPGREDEVGLALKQVPAIAGVAFKDSTIESFDETLEESQRIQGRILLLFAGIICCGVVYNAARISLEERARELGSLRVLGLTNGEVHGVLAGESFLLTCLSLPFGVGLGALFAWILTRVYDTDLYRFPFVLRPESVLRTVATVLAFTLLATLAVRRRVKKMDIVEVLKARE